MSTEPLPPEIVARLDQSIAYCESQVDQLITNYRTSTAATTAGHDETRVIAGMAIGLLGVATQPGGVDHIASCLVIAIQRLARQ